jgi:hypothetical protein
MKNLNGIAIDKLFYSPILHTANSDIGETLLRKTCRSKDNTKVGFSY